MAGTRKRGEEIRQFILQNVASHPKDIVAFTAREFHLTRQAVSKHIRNLLNQKVLVAHGATRNRQYELSPLDKLERAYSLDSNLEEHIVWRRDIVSLFEGMPNNVLDIWHYGFSEMLNNAIDHSSGKRVIIDFEKNAAATRLTIVDNGEGIFKKLIRELGFDDEQHAALELSKGKLTTDPENHTGEGIFFTSRMFDKFAIMSGNVSFLHLHEDNYSVFGNSTIRKGTGILMVLANSASRTMRQVFDEFSSSDENYRFDKTIVPVMLAQYGDEKLVSRSQAKRLLARIDRFNIAAFDFAGVKTIGQAFADEIFRVFVRQHPRIKIVSLNANPSVKKMINRVSRSDN